MIVAGLHLLVHAFFRQFTPSSILQQVGVILASALGFGFIERATKESWVLFDSFKKSSMLFMRLADAVPYATFLTDFNGRICYQNTGAKDVLENFCKATGERKSRKGNFLDAIHDSCKQKVQDAFKSAAKSQETVTLEAPLKTRITDATADHQPKPADEQAKESSLIAENRKLRTEGLPAFFDGSNSNNKTLPLRL